MSTFLFCWNPKEKRPPTLASLDKSEVIWRSGHRHHIPVGSRVFLIRLGVEPKGIVGCGWTLDSVQGSPPCVRLEFEALRDAPFIGIQALRENETLSRFHWPIQASGVELPNAIAAHLEKLWNAASVQDDVAKTVDLSTKCVYTIRHSEDLESVLRHGGTTTWTENKRWVEGKRLVDEGDREVPIIFSPAEKTRHLFGWALLTHVNLSSKRAETEYSFSGLQKFVGNRPLKMNLQKASDEKPLSSAFIRPYAICLTPSFLYETQSGSFISDSDASATKSWSSQDLANLGETDLRRTILARREQQLLRRLIVGRSGTFACQMCGREFPVDLLVAAHVKQRSECSESERCDPENVIALCKLGCDDLFERGYIAVRAGIVAAGKTPPTESVRDYLTAVSGKACPAWSESRRRYFQWREEQLSI